MSDHILATDFHNFRRDVLEVSHSTPVLVDFWADWCPPCRVVAPVLESVVKSLDGRLKLVKVEVDDGENMKLAGHYRVRGFPTIALFHHEKEVGRFSGARSHSQVMAFLHEHLGADLPPPG